MAMTSNITAKIEDYNKQSLLMHVDAQAYECPCHDTKRVLMRPNMTENTETVLWKCSESDKENEEKRCKFAFESGLMQPEEQGSQPAKRVRINLCSRKDEEVLTFVDNVYDKKLT